MKKAELKRLILDYLVKEDMIPDDELDSASSEVEIRRLELEHNAREQEKQRECQLKLKELELREKEIAAKKELDLKERELAMKKELELKEKEIDMQLKLKKLELKSRDTPVTKEASSSSVAKESFDFIRHVKLVAPFQEHEIDKFFLHFEKVAANLRWPSEIQAMLLQSVLIGKAREVYSALSVEQSSDYSLMKRAVSYLL